MAWLITHQSVIPTLREKLGVRLERVASIGTAIIVLHLCEVQIGFCEPPACIEGDGHACGYAQIAYHRSCDTPDFVASAQGRKFIQLIPVSVYNQSVSTRQHEDQLRCDCDIPTL